jgi:Uma2 family endonuclease
VSSPARALTWRQFVRLPQDGFRHELHRGRLLMTPPPGTSHGAVALGVGALLLAWVRPRRLGRVTIDAGVRLSPDTCVGPDVAFLSAARRDRLDEPYFRGAPDLVVEVVSPSTRRVDRVLKRGLYRRHGVREYWIVDPDTRRFEVLDFERRRRRVVRPGGRFESSVLPGLTVDVAAVFSVLDE